MFVRRYNMVDVNMNKYKRILASLIGIVIGLMMCMSVYAKKEGDAVDSRKFIAKDNAVIESIVLDANGYIKQDILTYNSGSGIVLFSNKKYASLLSKQKVNFMTRVLSYIQESQMDSKTKLKFYNFIAEQDNSVTKSIKFLKTNASSDLASAMKWFRPFTSTISTAMGVICLLIFTMMTLSIILDTTYLAFPFLQSSIRKDKPTFVSREAWTTLKECEKTTEYRSVVVIYMKRRFIAFLVLGVCLLYLASGQIYDIIMWVLDIVQTAAHYMFPNYL